MKKQGISGSSGIAIAKVMLFDRHPVDVSPKTVTDTESEQIRFKEALETSKVQLQGIYEKALKEIGEEEAAIFDAHLMVLEDPEYINNIQSQISDSHFNAEYAVQNATEHFAGMFEALEDAYFAARASDIRDVGNRILHNLIGEEMIDLSNLAEDVIIVSDDLAPSDTAQMDKCHVKGFATNIGSRTSHSAIMARSLEIPAVLGLKNITEMAKNGQIIIVDGIQGTIVLDPSDAELAVYQAKKEDYDEEKADLDQLRDLPAITTDGHCVELAGNIGKPGDVEGVLRHGGTSIGLYRTEFLYMDSDTMPEEEKQFEAYKSVAESFPEGSVIIRTMDIGGDKKLPYLPMEEEMNPFLGLRAIRLCLKNKQLLKDQLRAILRASVFGKIRIMFPMISGITELLQAKTQLAEVMDDLEREGISYDKDIEIGVMIEIPSAAITADLLSREADFFSIGTNDLCQYTLAVDRMNPNVSYLYDPLHPAVLRLIKNVIDASDGKAGFFTGMCGEMAGDPASALILLGLGLEEFSMSAASIPAVKKMIRSVSFAEAKDLAERALCETEEGSVRHMAEQTLASIMKKNKKST